MEGQHDITIDKSYLTDIARALKEFAKTADLISSNKPVYKIDEGGLKRTCFRRRENFTPSGESEIADLLRKYELGDDEALSTIGAIMEGLPVSIRMEIQEEPFDVNKRMITHIILVHRGDIFKILGFKF